ncbi:hypothetical protein PR202_gb08243 [Eleusine coracana subsp. coracana]|uniref:Uncharacterized protein n=1 Tax=Eleusine coracana subsp. coracana TaxID=191504 RepID=A0AAV5EEF6_ELECO|nr:hypothetical protein PR202_gb08243 [Eleusine coracana subsp. coracana]
MATATTPPFGLLAQPRELLRLLAQPRELLLCILAQRRELLCLLTQLLLCVARRRELLRVLARRSGAAPRPRAMPRGREDGEGRHQPRPARKRRRPDGRRRKGAGGREVVVPYFKSKLQSIYNKEREARLQATLWGQDDARFDEAGFVIDQEQTSQAQAEPSSGQVSNLTRFKKKFASLVGVCYPWIHATNEGLLATRAILSSLHHK